MEKTFYKYCSINENSLRSIENNYFYYATPKELNDLFEVVISANLNATTEEISVWGEKLKLKTKFIEHIIKNSDTLKRKDILDKVKSGVNKIRDNLYVFCVTEKFDDDIMWAHYGNSNRGACLGYESIFINDAYLFEIDKKIINRGVYSYNNKNYTVLLEVDYTKVKLIAHNPFKPDEEAVFKEFFRKKPVWAYENEYRAILVNEDINSKFEQKISYNRDILKEIIFGAKTSEEDIKKVVEAVVKGKYNIENIKFKKIKEDYNTMKLIKNKINITKYLEAID